MRTTIDLPDQVFRKAKAVASLEGVPLKQFITRAIEHELEAGTPSLNPKRVSLPIVRSKHPGSVRVTPERIASLLEAEDLHVSP
jgi:hypothetical protein